MNRTKPAGRRVLQPESGSLPRLLLLAGCFLAGAVLGQVLARRVPASAGDQLTRYLTDYFALCGESALTPAAALTALWLYFRCPAAAFLLGFVPAGAALLPVLTAAFGFSLSFSVCCFTAAFGGEGVLLALAVFGLRCAVTLPCYFLLAVPALGDSAARAGLPFGRGTPGSRWPGLLGCGSAILAGACVDLLFSPLLLRAVLERILF